MANLQGKLKLVPGSWYGWQMVPGYLDDNVSYFSPIFINKITPAKSGNNLLHIDFQNVLYAEGVQDFSHDIQILKHTESYMVADILYESKGSDRAAIISQISFDWLEEFCPDLWRNRPPSLVGNNASNDVIVYLDTVFRIGKCN